jgi:hypothetical protein
MDSSASLDVVDILLEPQQSAQPSQDESPTSKAFLEGKSGAVEGTSRQTDDRTEYDAHDQIKFTPKMRANNLHTNECRLDRAAPAGLRVSLSARGKRACLT